MSRGETNPDFDFPGLNLKQGQHGKLSSLRVTRSYTYATLPASPTLGWIVVLTDSNSNTWGANITASGAFTVIAWYNGTNWTVLGK